MGEIKFSDGFLWGSATSAYQVEGRIYPVKSAEGGAAKRQFDRVNNDWSEAARQGRVPAAGRACDHYNRYEEDFNIAKSLGQNAHRFSIEWARVEPEEGRFDEGAIEHYCKVLLALRERGLEPFVTLWHFTLPIWFAKIGGFENKKASFYFARYCEYVVSKIGEYSQFFITINEPMIYASQGYFRGVWPPFKKNIFKFMGVVDNLAVSHNVAYQKIKALNPNLQVGIAKNNVDFDSPRFNLIGRLIQLFRRLFWNHYIFKKILRHQDFVGLNFYFHNHFGYKFYEKESDMGWPIYPPAIHHVLMELRRYQKPIYITENGVADAEDRLRAKFIRDNLYWVHRAIHDGINIRGYFYWSLLDNFEWDKGFWPRFGLVEMNYETLERKIRPSAYEYKKICKTNSLETSN